MRAVIDTGVLVSGLIRGQGAPGAVLQALASNRVTAVYTTETMLELIEVLERPKFRTRYHVRPEDIVVLVQLIRLRGQLVAPQRTVSVCRDPKDDKFLTAAVAGQAECIVSGDADLLILSPFEDIPILTPAAFLTHLSTKTAP